MPCPVDQRKSSMDMRVDYVAFNKTWIAKTEGGNSGRPYHWYCISTDSAGLATPTKAHSQDVQGVLGLQR